MPLHYMVAAAVAFTVFILVFIRPDAGLYMVLFSMLLSPEFGSGASQRLADPSTQALILAALKDSDAGLNELAVNVLAQKGLAAAFAVPALIEVLKDSKRQHRDRVVEAIDNADMKPSAPSAFA